MKTENSKVALDKLINELFFEMKAEFRLYD